MTLRLLRHDSSLVWMVTHVLKQDHYDLYVKVVETSELNGGYLPQEVDQSALPGYGCLYTIGKLYSILPLLLEKIDINMTQWP